jgi:hypothetical protein
VVLLTVAGSFSIMVLLMGFIGVCWITTISGLNAAVIGAAPGPFKGRILSVYLVAFFSGSFSEVPVPPLPRAASVI